MDQAVKTLLAENARRQAEIHRPFNPITGQGSVGERKEVCISDYPIKRQWLPTSMLSVPLVRLLIRHGSVGELLRKKFGSDDEQDRLKIVEQLTRLRILHDFAFAAATLFYIKNKGGGDDVLFRLTRPQRRLVERLEAMRRANKPIRLILLKARQWGGSTTIQLYMAWLQLTHRVGLNSLIIAHQTTASDEIKDMFDRMLKRYPASLLHRLGEAYDDDEAKTVGVGKSGQIQRVIARNCKIKIGTAERPDSCRGGDYNLVHLSEVGLWKTTEKKTPQDIVRSACQGVLLKPYTMIVYESTANGTGNFFHREYDAAKRGASLFEPLFIAWFDIDLYTEDFPTDDARAAFAEQLWLHRDDDNVYTDREESGKYLWWLWQKGATLEAIRWYVTERSGCSDHAVMASEYPSDDVEAFVHSGQRVFDKYRIEEFRAACRPPRYVGDVYGSGDSGKAAIKDVRFREDRQGMLWVWDLPDIDPDEKVTDRYLVVVDIGGRSRKADWSVILVIDRLFMTDGGQPMVVAQWYGHIDMDLLSWKAMQIASFYDNALLVIESNTLETHDKERSVDGDQSQFILNQIREVYPNIYARRQSEEDIINGYKERKYGFHTNVSTKPMVISTLVKAIREHSYIERDERCLEEYNCYERKPNGAFGAIVGKHDDLLMTRAIGLHICFFEMDVPRIVPRKNTTLPTHRRMISEADF
jgi:hypothetical protein